MKNLQSQTIELYSKQLRTPMFNQYSDVVRQLNQNQSYEDFLIARMKLELDSRQESTRRRKIKYAGFPYVKTMDELIEQQKLNIRKAEKAVEEARIKLTVVMQERKMQEKLREKAFEEFVQEQKEAEARETDQRSSFTYGQRIQNNR